MINIILSQPIMITRQCPRWNHLFFTCPTTVSVWGRWQQCNDFYALYAAATTGSKIVCAAAIISATSAAANEFNE
jgi:hypothetical protein